MCNISRSLATSYPKTCTPFILQCASRTANQTPMLSESTILSITPQYRSSEATKKNSAATSSNVQVNMCPPEDVSTFALMGENNLVSCSQSPREMFHRLSRRAPLLPPHKQLRAEPCLKVKSWRQAAGKPPPLGSDCFRGGL